MQRWLNIVLIIVGIFAALFALSFLIPFAPTVCEYGEATKQPECYPHHLGPFFFLYAAAALKPFSELLTALGTLAIAGFTLTLWLVTGKTVELANAEFIASHRPKIIIHSVEFLTTQSPLNQTIGADITAFNIGDTPAKNLIISGGVFEIEGDRVPPGLKIPEIARHEESVAGTAHQIPLSLKSNTSVISHKTNMLLSDADGDEEYVSNLRCIGTISYEDGNGVRRVTGFCWRLKAERWVRQSRSAYEYAY